VSSLTLPIVCAWCDRVRTSGGRWEEAGLADREAAEATHGICPECLAQETRAAALALPLALDCR
jgi:hypothetical protein